MTAWEIFAWGVGGGAASQIMLLYRARTDYIGMTIRQFISLLSGNMIYICIVLAMIIVGGFVPLAYQHSNAPVNAILAFHLGISAPLVLSTFVGILPDPVKVG